MEPLSSPLRLLGLISLRKCGTTALQDLTASLVMVLSWSSAALFKKWKDINSSVGRDGAWAPSVWPLKTFPQHLLLPQPNRREALGALVAAAVSRAQHCPARLLCSFQADCCLYFLGCSRMLHGMNPHLPSSWKWMKQGCNFSPLRAFTFLFFSFCGHLRSVSNYQSYGLLSTGQILPSSSFPAFLTAVRDWLICSSLAPRLGFCSSVVFAHIGWLKRNRLSCLEASQISAKISLLKNFCPFTSISAFLGFHKLCFFFFLLLHFSWV